MDEYEKHCAECGDTFNTYQANRYLCRSCSPNCIACGDLFNPSIKGELLCLTCLTNKSKFICTSCGASLDSKQRQKSIRGFCESCEEARKDYEKINGIDYTGSYCVLCSYAIMPSSLAICEKCSNKKDVCSCGAEKNLIDFVCMNCKE